VKGYRDDTVLVGDPVRGLNKYGLGEFGKMWNGIALAITNAPNNRNGYFNLARDWNPYATAPVEANTATASINDLTMHFAPAYQIVSQFEIDAPVGTVQ
jgi:uncharacterized protein